MFQQACDHKQQDYIDQILHVQNVPFLTTAELGDWVNLKHYLLFMNTLKRHLLLSNVVDCLYKFKKHTI